MSYVLASTPLFFICDEVAKFNKWDRLNNEKRKILMSVLKGERLRKYGMVRTYIDLLDDDECYKAGFALSWNAVWEGEMAEDVAMLGERSHRRELRRRHEKFIIRKRLSK
tara:strand:+ start:1666 stop:1995 length:330 start_codon:yes stop_codon:yes gene_type:complete